MNSATLIAVLATQLLFCGGLLALIARGLPPRNGIARWAVALLLYGIGYAGRLAIGLETTNLAVPLVDAPLVVATLVCACAARAFSRRPLPWAPWLALVPLLFMLLEAAAIERHGAVGRHVVLDAVLGVMFAVIAAQALNPRVGLAPPLRKPVMTIAVLMGLLSATTLLRAAAIVRDGEAAIYDSVLAQAYYGYASLAAVLLALCLVWLVFERLTGKLSTLATHDPLTRVLNRNGLEAALARHFGTRGASPLTVIAFDLDHFKHVNDRHGHAAGDRLLQAMAQTLAGQLRPNDLVARIGGEEFLVVCGTGPDDTAPALAERLRDAASRLIVSLGERVPEVQCTVSVGVSQPFASIAECGRAAAEADAALYAAKAAGRNRVVSARSLPGEVARAA